MITFSYVRDLAIRWEGERDPGRIAVRERMDGHPLPTTKMYSSGKTNPNF